MGSITSRPKMPSITTPRVVYVPAPAPTPISEPDPGPSAEEEREQTRRANLLTRSRGRIGTITTSYRGLLSRLDDKGGAKTLLGE